MFGIYVNPGKFFNHSVSKVPVVFPFFLILSLFPIIFLLFVFYKKKIVVFTPLSRTRGFFHLEKIEKNCLQYTRGDKFLRHDQELIAKVIFR